MPTDPIIGQGIGVGMGILLQGANDTRQRNQQKALSEQQFDIDKRMTDYQKMKELEMWKKTGVVGQMEQLKLAGLNPALLYGMSGAGGATTGGGAASSHGANAPAGGGEIMGMSGMGLQGAMAMAQIENMKADTNKKNVEANKTAGVDTTEAETRIKSLTAGITNTEAITALTKVETTLKQLDVIFQGESIEDRLDQVEFTAKRALTELENAQTTTYINKATREEQINIVKTELVGAALRNGLTAAQTLNTGQATAESKARVENMAKQLIAEYDKMSIQNTELLLKKLEADIKIWAEQWDQDHPSPQNMVTGEINKLTEGIKKTAETIKTILEESTKSQWRRLK